MTVIRAGSRQWDGLIVLCAVNSHDGFRMADWHVAEHLSRLAPVLYVDPPASAARSVRRPGTALPNPRLRVLRPGLARLTPIVQPFPSRHGRDHGHHHPWLSTPGSGQAERPDPGGHLRLAAISGIRRLRGRGPGLLGP